MGVPGEKPLRRGRVENQQQTQATHDAGSGNRTLDTLVGDKRSHHSAWLSEYKSSEKID